MRLPHSPPQYNQSIETQRSAVIEREVNDLQAKTAPFYFGTGVPAFTPNGRALYIRLDGGANTTLYVYEGAAWAAK